MRLIPGQITYACREHEPADVPLHELVVDGQLVIYPEVAQKGYFDLDYGKGRLSLRATRWVGLIPVSDRVVLHVRPKVEIENLLRMVARARTGHEMRPLDAVVRGYGIDLAGVDDPEAVYAAAFAAALGLAATAGVIKRYRERTSDVDWRGPLRVAESVERYYARGVRYRHVFAPVDLTVDNDENRILKFTANRVLPRLADVAHDKTR